MRKICSILSVAFFLCLNQACTTSTKGVKAVVEEGTNYIFHVLTLGGAAPDDPEYVELYGETVSAEDRKYLREHKSLLVWGNGNTGALTQLFMFIPGYLNLQSQSELNEYFDLLSNSFGSKDFKLFVQRYEAPFKKMELWSRPIDVEAFLQNLVGYTNEVTAICEIFKNNFEAYHLNVWQEEKEKLEKTANTVNREVQKFDFIGRWEQLTGATFKTEDFQVVLFSANKNGPSANSLGYERDAFYHGIDSNMMLQFIAHEVGTHILIDAYVEILKMNRFEFHDSYAAYENLAEFYTTEFIFKSEPAIGYDTEKYCQIFKELYYANQGISSVDLMVKGIEVYNAR